MKVLNAYSGIGGNRKLWENVDVTAIELNPKIAEIYQQFFPDDKIIIADAHQYILENYKSFEFIWSSPPCGTHSVSNNFLNAQGVIRYPDMGLWQEIVFLKAFFKGNWVVENVKSYYKPLFKPTEIDRHYFWSNFYIAPFRVKRDFNINIAKICSRMAPKQHEENLREFHKINLPEETKNKRLLLRNCVYPPLGKHILDCSKRTIQLTLKDEGTE